ncbi:protein of unassigned function [Methylobacterium oryzae CBMB20]|uniref:Protein of unassigned function n=1 Tax=Methylobacterium oryzae CBMB20 TaxID=693986 RepID=A0A089P0G9_9HYPH|nr:protein of unassigned function [Methylobacterium oryzae CBMB20]
MPNMPTLKQKMESSKNYRKLMKNALKTYLNVMRRCDLWH